MAADEEHAEANQEAEEAWDYHGYWGLSASESEESEPAPEGTRLLRQWRGATRPEQVDRLQEVQRRTITRRHGHNVYRNTKVTSLAQEEQSAMPAGVTNVWENSSDDEAWDGADSKELDAEWQALRVAKHWLSDNGPELNNRGAEAEALAMGADGAWVQLRKPTDAKREPAVSYTHLRAHET